jgi:orotidine-5'-phosphate decarboxylase
VLAPGLGAQGGAVADLRRLFGSGTAVVPTVSRDVLAAGPDPAALRAAADRWTSELAG